MSTVNTIQFGTDGIRGPYGIAPLDPPSLQYIAQCIATFIGSDSTIAIARDTRYSGVEIVELLSTELMRYGVHILDCEILPTAALACVVVDHSCNLGIVVTASHNPASDNGIKLFNAHGMKLSTIEQQALEASFGTIPPEKKGSIQKLNNPAQAWRSRLPDLDLSGWTILLDCAHGALSPFGGNILTEFGAQIIERASSPNGVNINDNVGALHPPLDIGDADIALCFDGDADRIQMVTQDGLLDGDDFLWLLRNEIQGPLVGTIMSNGGLDEALKNRLIRAKVGDKYVLASMHQSDSVLGAEPSGHVIFLDGNMPAGDGLYAALRILKAIGKPPVTISWNRWPTHQQSIRFSANIEKPSLEEWNSIETAKESGHRLVVRYSGTEPKLRILVEGPDCAIWSQRIADEFREKISMEN